MQGNKVSQKNTLAKRLTQKFIKDTGLMALTFAAFLQAQASPSHIPSSDKATTWITQKIPDALGSGLKQFKYHPTSEITSTTKALSYGGWNALNKLGKIAQKCLPALLDFVYMHPYYCAIATASLPAAYLLKKKYDQYKWSNFERLCKNEMKGQEISNSINKLIKENIKMTISVPNTEDQMTITTPKGILRTMIKNSIEFVKATKNNEQDDIPAFLKSKPIDEMNKTKEGLINIDSMQVNDILAKLTMNNGSIKDVDALTKDIHYLINKEQIVYMTADDLIKGLEIDENTDLRIHFCGGNNSPLLNMEPPCRVLYIILNQYFTDTTKESYDTATVNLVQNVLPFILKVVQSAEKSGLLSNNNVAEKNIFEALKNCVEAKQTNK